MFLNVAIFHQENFVSLPGQKQSVRNQDATPLFTAFLQQCTEFLGL
jgi:hypothetical protein